MSVAILEAHELPNNPSRQTRKDKYPFDALAVGQGFVIKSDAYTHKSTAHNLAYNASLRLRKKFRASKQANGDFVITRKA